MIWPIDEKMKNGRMRLYNEESFFAILLVMMITISALPISALATAGKVEENNASISITDNGVVMNLEWKKVSGAEGYEYAYNLFWKKDSKKSDYTIKSTDKTSAKIQLKDYGVIDVYVRAYKTVGGKKVSGEWTHSRLKRDKVDKQVVKQLRKRMKSKNLFLRASSGTVNVYSGAGEQYRVVVKLSKLDEVRATGSFKRDGSGTWWSRVYVPIDQNNTVTGWVSGEVTDPVWY